MPKAFGTAETRLERTDLKVVLKFPVCRQHESASPWNCPAFLSFVSIQQISVVIYLFWLLYHFRSNFSLPCAPFFNLCPPPFVALSAVSESEDRGFSPSDSFSVPAEPWCLSLSQNNPIPARSQLIKPPGSHIHQTAVIRNCRCCKQLLFLITLSCDPLI